MGVQLNITAADMAAAGWSSEDVETQPGFWDTTAQDNDGGAPEWVPPIIDRKWSHPQHGVLWAYAVSSGDFFIDCNEWGSNRARCRAAGLFNLSHVLA